MASTTVQVKDPWWRSTLAIALGLDLLGACCIALAQYFIFDQSRDVPDKSFGENLPAAVLMLSAVAVWIAGGVVAAVALYRDRLKSTTGKWAVRLVLFNVTLLPLWGIVNGLFVLFGSALPEGWGEPIVPIWFLVGAVALGLGLASKHERAKGALVLPLLLGAATATFMLGELITQH